MSENPPETNPAPVPFLLAPAGLTRPPAPTQAAEPAPPRLVVAPDPPAELNPPAEPVKRGRGRPVGSLNKVKHPRALPKRIEKGSPPWEPTENEYLLIRQLAELGWPCDQIAEALRVSPTRFAGGIMRDERIKREFEEGAAIGKNFEGSRLAWRPMPQDIDKIYEWAAEGLGKDEIAAKLNISRRALANRMADTPQVMAAFEQGNGEYRAHLLEKAKKFVDQPDEQEKHISAMLIFQQKAHCGLVDKPQPQKVDVSIDVKAEHTHRLKAPEVVPISDIAEFARREMERARLIGEEKLKAIEVQGKVVDG